MFIRLHCACLSFLLIVGSFALGQGDSSVSQRSDSDALIYDVPGVAATRSSVEHLTTFTAPVLVGTYGPDGRFKKAPKRTRFRQFADNPVARGHQTRPIELPPWVDLHSVESVVENSAPPTHAIRAIEAHSQLGCLRDSFFTLLYGHQVVLHAPTHVTTDSRGRVIISDPDDHSIHVLDGKDSFRISGGAHMRLQQPHGLAVDAYDNIYVADETLGVVQVYDPQGVYLRTLGEYKGENMFDRPTGIAIDRQAARLYVLDSTVGQLIVLDLNGNVVQRVGGRRNRASKVNFDSPSEIAAGSNTVVVLDSDSTRIQVLDSELNLQAQFKVRVVNGVPDGRELGLALDDAGRIFVSNLGSSSVKVYTQDGRLVGTIDQFGDWSQKFSAPSGVWIDAADRIYVADTNTSRVHVFQAASVVAGQ